MWDDSQPYRSLLVCRSEIFFIFLKYKSILRNLLFQDLFDFYDNMCYEGSSGDFPHTVRLCIAVYSSNRVI